MICTLNFFYDIFIDNCCKGYVKKKKTCAKELKYTTQKDTQENNIIVNIDHFPSKSSNINPWNFNKNFNIWQQMKQKQKFEQRMCR